MDEIFSRDGYIQECARAAKSIITTGNFIGGVFQGYRLEEYMALLNNDYICKIYGCPPGTDVLPSNFFEEYIAHYPVHLLTSTIPPFELNGFLMLGKFFPADDQDPHWPKWQDKLMPDNSQIIELKLIACKKGFGRIMFCWGLYQAELSGKSTVVLEVLGGKNNQVAYQFYQQFGFKQKVAYDPVAGPFTQVRSDHGDISIYMGLYREDYLFISDESLLTQLNLTRTKRSKSHAGDPNQKEIDGEKHKELQNLLALFKSGFIMEEEFNARCQALSIDD